MEYKLQLLLVLILISTYFLFRNLKFPLSLTAFYFLSIGLLSYLFPQLLNNYFDPKSSTQALITLSYMSSTAIIILFISLLSPRSLLKLIPHIAVINCLYCIYRHFIFPLLGPGYALGLCPSVDGMFIALMYPYTMKFAINIYRSRIDSIYNTSISNYVICIFYLVIPISTIYMLNGSTGAGVLALSMLIIYVRPLLKFRLIYMLPLSAIMIILYKVDIVRDHHRLTYWKLFIDFWWIHANHWLGFGIGTFKALGPFTSIQAHLPELFIEAHNDWLQCLFEFGYIGLFLAGSLVGYCICRARNDKYLLATIVSYAIASFFYYPIHNPILGIFAVLLIKESLDLND